MRLFTNVVQDKPTGRLDYLRVVTAYIDVLLDRGRDIYGKEASPLIAGPIQPVSPTWGFLSAARQSIFGVFTIGRPAQPKVS